MDGTKANRKAPTVGVVLPHHACEPFLTRAVASILEQTYAHLELHVVDDASPDDRWLEAIREAAPDERVRLYRTTQRVGPYRIKNALIPRLSTPLIGFQDADDWSHPERFAVQVEALRRWRAGIVGSQFEIVLPDGSRKAGPAMPGPVNLYRRLGKQFLVLHPTSILRRSVFDDLGGFDGTTIFGADDDFIHRAAPHVRIRNVRQVLYAYRRRPQSLTGSATTGLGSDARRAYEAAAAQRRADRSSASWLPWLGTPVQAPRDDTDVELVPVPLP